MKKKAALLIALTLNYLFFSITPLTGWVQAKPNPQQTRGSILYVTVGGAGGCTSWASACGLQGALTWAQAGDEIWVEAGTYYPSATDDRSESFNLISGVALYGGFAGTETTLEQRNWIANPTILSGDIGATENNSDNSYHVMVGTGLDSTTILDGFTITAGNANGPYPDNSGGGMFNDSNSSPTLINVTFFANLAGTGGGMYNELNSSPMLTDVTFSNNIAILGGGMYNVTNSSLTLTNVLFTQNFAYSDGGGMYNYFTNSTLTNITFDNNTGAEGAGVYNDNSNAIMTNVTFSGNSATGFYGSVIHNNNNSNLTLTNAILYGNYPFSESPIYDEGNASVVTYSDIEGGWPGETNINQDPMLWILADNGGFTQTHALLPGSPAIDNGSPTICPSTDQRGFPRPTEGDGDEIPECDMGAYEAHQTIFVDEDATGLNNGTSWTDAFIDLQDALSIANEGDQIWVAEGIYLPSATGDRSESFQLINGVAIYGGFAATETTHEQRDWISNLTTLSGDIGTPDETSDNSYHVVFGTNLNSTTILDGFTITAGNAADSSGGGMYNNPNSSPTLTNLIFSSNSATSGGGMSNITNSNPTLAKVTFSANSASSSGGGMFNANSHPILLNVSFTANSGMFGGGMYNFVQSSPMLTNITFSNNSAVKGGGVYNDWSHPVLTNVTFSNNSATDDGGGMYNELSSQPSLTNVTMFANSALGIGGGMFNYESITTLKNSILWGNAPDQMANNSSTVTITYSDIQGGYAGTGNINLDPLLGPLADNGGFTLTHALLPGSPAIDTGSPSVCPSTDQRGYYRPIDGDWDAVPRCDMGAYEYGSVLFFYNYLPLVLK